MNTNGHGVGLGSGRGLLLSLYGFVYECPGLVAGFGGGAGCEERFPAESGTKNDEARGTVQHVRPGSGVDRRRIVPPPGENPASPLYLAPRLSPFRRSGDISGRR
jgi:hypothetical protein